MASLKEQQEKAFSDKVRKRYWEVRQNLLKAYGRKKFGRDLDKSVCEFLFADYVMVIRNSRPLTQERFLQVITGASRRMEKAHLALAESILDEADLEAQERIKLNKRRKALLSCVAGVGFWLAVYFFFKEVGR